MRHVGCDSGYLFRPSAPYLCSTSRESAVRSGSVDDDRELPAPASPHDIASDQFAHKVRDVRHGGAVRTEETAHQILVQRIFGDVALQECVGTNHSPLNERTRCTDAVTEKV